MSKPIKDKKSNLTKLEQQCAEYLNGWQRAQADYANLKKQIVKEKEEFIKFANLNLLLGLIPVYNNFQLSFEHLPADLQDHDWVTGISHVKNQFQQVLEHNGVSEINPAIGQEFNPAEQEAVAEEKDQNNLKETKGKIKKVVNPGYKLNEKVFIPAKVIVA